MKSKQFIIGFLLCCLYPICFVAQPLHDQQWILGALPGSNFNFNNSSLDISYFEKTLRMNAGVTTMCDINGSPIFYSNGCRIFNAEHEIMENGNNLAEGSLLDGFCAPNNQGSPLAQSIIALPIPDRINEYVVIYQDMEGIYVGSLPNLLIGPSNLLYALIDMSLNAGLGSVVEKNEVILTDTISSGFLQAVQHANGRDWWIINPKGVSNCYFKFLLSPEGFDFVDDQCLGYEWNHLDIGGQSSFTRNGDRYVRSNAENGLDVFDFDRCSGSFSNPQHITFLPQDTGKICSGLALSPNGRFAYVTTSSHVYQYDLEAADITMSRLLIAEYDSFQNPGPTNFCMAQLAPDRKIYISSFGYDYNLHIIHDPDSFGLACNLIQHDLEVDIALSMGLPSHPNYSLGPLEGSPCDSIDFTKVADAVLTQPLQIQPNPGKDIFYFQLPSNETHLNLQLTDITGKIIFTQEGFDFNQIDLTLYPVGVYIIKIKGKKGNWYIGKCIKI